MAQQVGYRTDRAPVERDGCGGHCHTDPPRASPVAPFIDVPAVDSSIARIDGLLVGKVDPLQVEEPAARYLMGLLECPALAKRAARGSASDTVRLLDSRCNFR